MKDISPSFCVHPWVNLLVNSTGTYSFCCIATTGAQSQITNDKQIETWARKIIKDPVDKVKALIEMDLRIKEFKIKKKEKEIKVIFDDKVKKHLTDEMKKRIIERVNKLTGEKITID